MYLKRKHECKLKLRYVSHDPRRASLFSKLTLVIVSTLVVNKVRKVRSFGGETNPEKK